MKIIKLTQSNHHIPTVLTPSIIGPCANSANDYNNYSEIFAKTKQIKKHFY